MWYLAAAIIFFAAKAVPIDGLSPQAQSAIAVFLTAGFLWFTNSFPIAITGLLVLLLLPLSGALPAKEAYSYFGSDAVFFILGAFILASPIMRSGLSNRIVLWALQRLGTNPVLLISALLWIPAFMTFFINEHAVAVMMFPIGFELARVLNLKPGSRFGTAIFLAIAWGTVIGGMATLLGGARAPLALGVLKSNTGSTISFLDWFLASLPIVLSLLWIAQLLLVRITPRDLNLDRLQSHIQTRASQLGPPSTREKKTLVLTLVIILLWILAGDVYGLGTIALLGAVLTFVIGITDWHEIEEDVNWGIFLMYGGAIALSTALQTTGAAPFIAEQMLPFLSQAPQFTLYLLILISLLLTEVMSNTATVAMLMPIALGVANTLGLAPEAVTLSVALPAGLALMLPVSTPAIALAVGSRHVRTADVFRYGALIKAAGLVIFLLVSHYYWPILGFTTGAR